MSDPLSRATQALKDLHDEAPPPPLGTRELVLERAELGRRERRVSRAILVPLAAAFVLLATWAAASGTLSRVLFSTRPSGTSSEVSPPEHPQAQGRGASSEATDPKVPALASAEALHERAPMETPAASSPPRRAPEPAATEQESRRLEPSLDVAPALSPRTASTPSTASAATAPAAATPSDTLYATAHRAHFEDRDPSRALAAWEAYLADAPAGRFAPEARYNRALCLVRLGRNTEAASALRPFAEASVGSYRQAEAEKLLAAIASASSGTPVDAAP